MRLGQATLLETELAESDAAEIDFSSLHYTAPSAPGLNANEMANKGTKQKQ